MIKLGAKELRKTEPTEEDLKKIKRNPIYIVLDSVLDTYNVGAIFRLADAVSAEMVYLCGETATPGDPKVGHKIEKASVGTWKWVGWQYASSAVEAIVHLKSQISNLKIVAVEQHEKSIPYTKVKYELPLALVVGNETSGVSKEVLDKSDLIVEIPMWGVNKSLNVMVSLAIVLFKVMEKR